ncbi:hypothetical protein Plhal703r1_c02g0010451 [Plasmopara halstedii]
MYLRSLVRYSKLPLSLSYDVIVCVIMSRHRVRNHVVLWSGDSIAQRVLIAVLLTADSCSSNKYIDIIR